MRKYYKIPLVFLLLAAALGLFLRWQFVAPTSGIRYTFFLHAHSHVMFLGWVFNVLNLSFLEHNVPEQRRKSSMRLFILFQLLVVAMMISFPIQGYGLFSIVFSTLHTLGAPIFIPLFFTYTKDDQRVSTWFARAAWVFFFISTAGPFSLGYLMANDLGHTVWYNFSIYYYLHFQYNGFFLFGIFSLFFQMLEQREIVFSNSKARIFGTWMAIACVPAYTLSILFAKPGIILNIIGGAAALTQLIALIIFLGDMHDIKHLLRGTFSAATYKVFHFIFCALILKFLLQLASAHPCVADLAYALRPVVIAYLHLVLVGIITFFLLVWYIEKQLVKASLAKLSILLLFAGFIGSEICLVLSPWWSVVVGSGVTAALIIFVSSVLMFLACGLFYISFVNTNPHSTKSVFTIARSSDSARS